MIILSISGSEMVSEAMTFMKAMQYVPEPNDGHACAHPIWMYRHVFAVHQNTGGRVAQYRRARSPKGRDRGRRVVYLVRECLFTNPSQIYTYSYLLVRSASNCLQRSSSIEYIPFGVFVQGHSSNSKLGYICIFLPSRCPSHEDRWISVVFFDGCILLRLLINWLLVCEIATRTVVKLIIVITWSSKVEWHVGFIIVMGLNM